MVFVTGGSGLVGSHILLELLRSGREVRALCRPQSNLDRVGELFSWYGPESALLFSKIQWVRGDLNDLPFLETAFEGVTEVFHCAALISFDPRDEDRLLKINQEGTRNIVNLCLDKGVSRLYYTSSIATIGGNGDPLTEDNLWDPGHTNVYATSKYLAEMEVWRGAQEGLNSYIVNPGVILGPGFWTRGSGRFFTRVAAGMRYAPPGGTGFVGVWDVVRAMRALGDAGASNQRFILVGDNLTYLGLMERIARLLQVEPPRTCLSEWQLEILWRLDWIGAVLTGKARRLSKEMARSLPLQAQYSSEKLKKLLGFEFQPIDEVLNRCAANYSGSDQNDQS